MKDLKCPENEMSVYEKILEKRKKKLDQIPDTLKSKYARSITSRAMAVAAMCHECIGWEDVRDGIRDCRGYDCPLYAHRYYKFDDTEETLLKVDKALGYTPNQEEPIEST